MQYRYDRDNRTAVFAWALMLAAWFVVLSVAADGSTSVVPVPAVSGGPSGGPLLPIVLSPPEERLFADASDGALDEHTLLAAALVAGGVTDPTKIEHYQKQIDARVAQLRRSGLVSGSPKQRARAVFEFMHGRLLCGGYRLEATDLTTVLETGRFNCVSASVLFCYLGERFGLDVRGLELPGHAMSRLHFGEGAVDVESTCPRWFRLAGDPRRRAELVERTTGFRYDERRQGAGGREVSGVALVATIYYNRGVDLLAQKKFAEAVEANTKALGLDPSSATARGNLLATLNNWAIAEGEAGHFNEAVGLLRSGLALQADFRTFRANFIHVHRQWIEALCRRGEFEQSCAVLLAARRDLPDEPWFAETLQGVYRRWVSSLLAAEGFDGALAAVDVADRLQGVGGRADAPLTALPADGEHFISDWSEGMTASDSAEGIAL